MVNGGTLDLAQRLKAIPADMRDAQDTGLGIYRFSDYAALFVNGTKPMTDHELLKVITRLQQDTFNLQVLGNAFTPQTITVGTSPTLIVPQNRVPRGYLFLNPNTTVNGVTTDTNLFAPAVRGAGTFTSAVINVQAFRTSRFFLDITVPPATLSVNILTRDPQSLNFATAQTNIFGGAVAVGTYYADAGEIGTDDFLEIQVVQTGAGANWSLSMVSKEAYGATVSPASLFLGNANVTVGLGYPLLGGQEKRFILAENTPLFAVASVSTPIRIFQLQ